ncbi:hypothetical protein BX600DRAFT_551219 [Xylariales sp. PMI_506]|nr:hypothetical protein BX600DRAFT_551219 [Xylariales sp. PMI_506]
MAQIMPRSKSAIERGNPPARRKACGACIKGKRRCDLQRPSCLRCAQRRLPCVYPPGRATPHSPPESISDDSASGALVQDPDDLFQFSVDNDVSLLPEAPLEALGLSGSTLIFPDADYLSQPFSDSGFILADGQESSDLLNTMSNEAATLQPDEILIRSLVPHSKPIITKESRNTAINTRLRYAIDELNAAPRRMVMENNTPWCHPLLYQEQMPRCMQDAYAACGLYQSKNAVNAPFIMRNISTRAAELVAEPLPTAPRDLLAHLQALFLYQTIRLMDGDIYARAAAERHLSALEHAATTLMGTLTLPDPGATPEPLVVYPVVEARRFWYEWIFQESARRTCLIVFLFLQIYRLISGAAVECDGKLYCSHAFTASAYLWNAASAVQFAQAWGERNHLVVLDVMIAELMYIASADELDVFSRMLFTSMMGIEEFEGWLISKGGKL